MVRRLIEAHYQQYQDQPTEERVRFWLLEARTPQLLVELVKRFDDAFKHVLPDRPLLHAAQKGDLTALRKGLIEEQEAIRGADEQYWAPLKRELEQLRRDRRK